VYLFRLAGHGSQKEFAARYRVSAVSVSRWCNGSQIPRQSNMEQLFRFFGIDASDDLRGVPFFLVDAPISDHTRRAWLHRWVDRCPPATLLDLFPALRKLLRDDDDP
jgi:transcriptional regulator with XRE-family HTH domain